MEKLIKVVCVSVFLCYFCILMNTLTLYELTSMVSETITDALPGQYWVEAELMEIREVRGHCFMELVQKDIHGATPIAKASAKCWQTKWMKVLPRFRSVAGSAPLPGMKLLLLVAVDFHPTYGFSLIVNNIDPTFTLGDMARRRMEIISQLKEEGVFDLQKELSLPVFCQNIAVISSETAAGYGDFCNQLINNDYGFAFHVELFPAVMQGEQIEQSIIERLDEIAERMDDFDCVVIIRGGGATSDMSGFDTLLLAENVANFPLPIITGIGHDRDECILDMISYQKVKTPTAAAAFLIDHLMQVKDFLDEKESTILDIIANAVEKETSGLALLVEHLKLLFLNFRQKEESTLLRKELEIKNSLQQTLLYHNHQLEMLSQRVNALNPKLLLKRGYSMTLLDGKVVKDAASLKSGDEIETLLSKGKIKSIVK